MWSLQKRIRNRAMRRYELLHRLGSGVTIHQLVMMKEMFNMSHQDSLADIRWRKFMK